jgi:hypothetical protein
MIGSSLEQDVGTQVPGHLFPHELVHGRLTYDVHPAHEQQVSGSFLCVSSIGHREVTSETLLPIILEVGTLGHILLTDKFQLPRLL